MTQHTDDSSCQYGKQLVPRIVGSKIPRQNDHQLWMIFTLAHFKPFHVLVPFIEKNSSLEDSYLNFSFSNRSLMIMKNWEETHECEDKRDEERLRKRIAATSESVAMTNALAVQKTQSRTEDSDDDDTFLPLSKKNPFKDFVVLQAIHVLEQAEWLVSPFHSAKITTSSATSLKKDSPFSKISASQLKLWMTSVKNQERIITQLRQNSSSTHLQPHSKVDINETEGSDSFFNFPSIILPDN